MIDDLSRTLEALLTRPGLPPELSLCDISFESPAPPFAPSHDTINLFLYDIQENLPLRSNERVVTRVDNQAITTLAPLRADCNYLVTAWVPAGVGARLKEQLLLTQVLTALAALPTIPNAFLTGALHDHQEPLPPMVVARGDELRHNAEFWTALGGKLRSSLRLTVTLSLPVFDPRTAFLVTNKTANFGGESLVQIGGRVFTNLGVAIPGAVVDILDAGMRARSDSEGRFSFPTVPSGSRTFRAIATGFQPLTEVRPVPGTPSDYEFHLTP